MKPRKAMILAAGLGTRMRPLTLDLPKPLMPLWNRPLLEHLLRQFSEWGVRDVLINLHHLPGEILAWARQRPAPQPRISFSFEPAILGTGGALRKAAWFFDDAPFWLANGDVAMEIDPAPLRHAFKPANTLAAVWLEPERGPRTVLAQKGRILNFHAPQPGAPGTQTFCGLHLLDRRILNFLPQEGFASIIEAYEAAMQAGFHIAGVAAKNSYWADLGTPAQYLQAHREIRDRFVRRQTGRHLYDAAAEPTRAGFCAQAADAQTAPGARLTDCVLWSGARAPDGVPLNNLIAGRGAELRSSAEATVVRADVLLTAPECAALRGLGWDPAAGSASPLPPRGSSRSFIRLWSGKRAGLLVRYSLDREENALYAGHGRFLLRSGVPVPRVLWDDPARCFTLWEDLGDVSLLTLAKTASRARLRRLYRAVIARVALFHTAVTRQAQRERLPLRPPFDAALYRWEHRLFIEHQIETRPDAREAARLARLLAQELNTVARRLEKLPAVLCHRDLQSSNILWRGGPMLIDFQGMRRGPALYDLASLLCDPYVELPLDLQLALHGDYIAATGRATPADPELFWWAAVQRLVQALGAYGRLARLPGGAPFARYIRPGAEMLLRASNQLRALPTLRAWAGERCAG